MKVILNLVHFFKVRYYAEPFDIWKECKSSNVHPYYISYDNRLYYGHPLFIFFYSSQNSWWIEKLTEIKQEKKV